MDLTIIQNQGPEYFGTAVFTTNKVVAAPVIWTKQVVKGEIVKAVVLNSGGANACTGPEGFADTHKTAELIGKKFGISAGENNTDSKTETLSAVKIIDKFKPKLIVLEICVGYYKNIKNSKMEHNFDKISNYCNNFYKIVEIGRAHV